MTGGQKRSFRDAARPATQALIPEFPTGAALTSGWLTQYGTNYFKHRPRFEEHKPPEFDLSMFTGRLTREETALAMTGRPARPHQTHRHFHVPVLVNAQYVCLHTPRPERPLHASVLAGCPGIDLDVHKQWWDDRDGELESLAGREDE